MVIQVNQELCTGCGACIDACSVGAIQLVNQRAVIDEALCTACKACIDACSNEAISMRPIPEPSMSIVTLPATKARPVPIWEKAALPEKAVPTRGLVPLAGAVLTFLGREVAPRLVDVVVDTLERRFVRSTTATASPVSTSTRVRTTGGRGERKQVRYRRGRTGNRNHKGRR